MLEAVKPIVDSLFDEANAVLQMASRYFPTLEHREMGERRAVCESHSATFVSVTKRLCSLLRLLPQLKSDREFWSNANGR